ncbi:MAG: MBL fold metallo-hydrolase [Planctomycetales bacterium]|nr:MBL fold metallo-hydrolase [Planctomycetales bacterium]
MKVKVLGIAQDGGVPHLGCRKSCCEGARKDPARRSRVSSVALCHVATGKRWIVDCTPDFPAQVDLLESDPKLPRREPREFCDGLLLTHAHIGHYAGLIHLGTEVMSAKEMPVWATARMGEFLTRNGPWGALVSSRQIALRALEPGKPVALAEGLSVTPFLVPHRDEYSDTVGFRIEGPRRRLVFLPDVDKWEKMATPLPALLEDAQVALLDGTFFSLEELPHRDITKVRHPLVTETLDLLRGRVAAGTLEVAFIHLNHTNPALDAASPERRRLEDAGFRVAREGEDFGL